MQKPILSLPVLILVFLISIPAQADTLYVDAGAAGENDGSSWTDAFKDLQDAVDTGVSGDEIWVAAGTYYPTVEHGGSGDRYRSFQMKNGVPMYGGFAGNETSRSERNWQANETVLSGDIDRDGSLDADNCYHVFYHTGSLDLDSTAVLDGFFVTGGYADGGDPDDSGGGMYNGESSPMVQNCTFSGNYSIKSGGGMYNWVSSPTVINCIFYGNDAEDGGGMSSILYPAALANCTFRGNSALYGAGIYNYYASSTLTNCTFSGNSALSGGGIYNHRSSPTVTNCILWGNTGETDGNEIYNHKSTPNISCSDIEGSGASDDWNTDIGTDKGGNIDSDPLFVSADDFHLTSVSPCIDAGTDEAVPSGLDEDFEGDIRSFDGNSDSDSVVDMGADEVVDTDRDSVPDYLENNFYYTDPSKYDTDDDGLSDGNEINTYDTDPNSDDSDGDGLQDYPEIYIYNTDPLDADTDGDGASDGDEVTQGSNPLVAEISSGNGSGNNIDEENNTDSVGETNSTNDAADSSGGEEEEEEGCFIGALGNEKNTFEVYALVILMLVAGMQELKGFRKKG